METTQATILYDQDCGFCRWSLSKILVWDRRKRLRPLPLQSAEADRLLPGVPEERKMASWHLVTDDGEVFSAGAATAPMLRLLPGGSPLAAIASASPRLTERAYRWVSSHRDGLARLVGSQACAVDPSSLGRGRPSP
jgi:predicted DCC family thiol-disulfide oxidoreductase YuxK